MFLEADGFQVLQVGTLGIMDAAEGGNLYREDALSPWPWRTAIPTPTWLLLPDTAVHTIAWLDDLPSTPQRACPACSPPMGRHRLGGPAIARSPVRNARPPRVPGASLTVGGTLGPSAGVARSVAERSGPARTGDGSRP